MKSLFQIWFRIYLIETFSYRFSFLSFRDALLYIKHTITTDDKEFGLLLFTKTKNVKVLPKKTCRGFEVTERREEEADML